MKINVNTGKRTLKMRILSAFMAVLIFSLTFCNSWFVTKSNAKSDTTKISNSTKESYFTADQLNTGNNSPYRYTGKIKPVTVSMYDYLTNNEELNISQYNSGKYLQDHPDQPQTDNGYTWWDYYNPYSHFDLAVHNWAASNSLVQSPSQNITIKFKARDLNDSLQAHLFTASNEELVKSMTYELTDGNQKMYSVTFPISELNDKTYVKIYFQTNGYQSLDSTGFMPISAGVAGSTYIWYRDNDGKGWDDTAHKSTFSWNSPDITVPGTALYAGFFLNEGHYEPNYKPSTYHGQMSDQDHYKERYNKYFWSANIAPRDSTSSSIKGLVDSTLTDGVVSQGGNKLPYFDSSFNGNANYNTQGTVMKSWESGSGDNDKISFPFYEVTRRASDAEGYTRGSADVDTDVARYYQFDSEQITVLFHPNDTTPTASYFEERSQSQQIRDTFGKSGFFPFNDTDSWYTDGNETFENTSVKKKKKNGEKNNYGFGAKFEMNFKLRSDGKVDVLDENCKSRENKGKVNTRFEFTGDDDLWVFIDGNLILDMGGGHAASEGYIDFCEREVKAKYITYTDSNKDSAYNTGSVAVQLSGDDFTNKLNGGFNQDGRTGYKEDEEHTMTIFYMERGMSESNLKIRYNFPVEANFGKMKIREITDYSAVNAGLQALTEKASEDDVFQYTILNTGTDARDVLKTGDKAPTTKNFVRTVGDITTQLTSSSSTPPSAHSDGETAEQGQFFDPNNSEVKGVSYNWVDGYAADPGNTAIVMSSDENVRAITDSGGNMYLMHGTNSVKSSGEFEGQFSRYSTMQITQGANLYKPNTHTTGGAAANLATSSARAFDSFYKIDKVRIFTTTQVSAEFKLENGDQFTFRNGLSQPNGNESLVQGSSTPDSSLGTTVQMTETFYNSPLLGAMTITKQLANNDNQTIITEPFTLRLKLTSIFGNSDVNVGAGQYEDIVAYKYDVSGTSSTPVYMTTGGDSTNGYYGQFTLSPGEILAIENIPVGTHYSVEEVAPTGAYREDTNQSSHVAEDIVEGVIEDKQAKNSSHNATVDNAIIVNTRVTNELKLVKEVTGSRAGNDQKNKEFNFAVVLEAPEGVTFKTGGTDNYPITITGYAGSGTITPSYTPDNKKCTLVIPVSHNDTHNNDVEDPITISGVPYDTKYTVTETIDSVDKAFWTLTGATGTEGTIIGQCTAKITNYFDDSATISLSKVDRTTKRIISGNGASGFTDATFKLLELKTTPDWTDSSVLTAFSNMINAANYTPAADSTYVEAVYPSDSSVLTATNGELVINDSTANVTISAGKKYFFYEVSAPTGYRADNKLSADRTIVTLTTGSNEVIIPNSSASVTVQKQNESGQGLPDAELDLYIHDVTKTETVNPSDVSSYETVEAAVPGDNHTSALPVLYTTNNNKISYTWSETADDPDYYNIKFINQFTDNSSWSTVKAVFIDSSNVTHEVNAESSQNGVFKFKNSGDYSTVYFTDGTNRTVDITLEKYNDATNNRLRYGYGYTYKPAQLIDSSKPAYAFTQYKKNDTTAYDGQYLVQIVNTAGASVSITTVENTETNEANRQYLYWEPPADYDNNQYCWFYQNDNDNGYITPDGQHHISSDGLITWNTGKQGRNGRNIRGVKIPSGANYVKFCCSNNAHYYNTGYIQISSIGVGKYLSVTTITIATHKICTNEKRVIK